MMYGLRMIYYVNHSYGLRMIYLRTISYEFAYDMRMIAYDYDI
jgi:hypothetical protein